MPLAPFRRFFIGLYRPNLRSVRKATFYHRNEEPQINLYYCSTTCKHKVHSWILCFKARHHTEYNYQRHIYIYLHVTHIINKCFVLLSFATVFLSHEWRKTLSRDWIMNCLRGIITISRLRKLHSKYVVIF